MTSGIPNSDKVTKNIFQYCEHATAVNLNPLINTVNFLPQNRSDCVYRIGIIVHLFRGH